GEGRAPGSGGGSAQSNGGRSQPSMSDAQMSGTPSPVRTVYAPPAEPAYPQPPSDPYYGRQALPAPPASPSPSRALARRPGGDKRSGAGNGNGRYGGQPNGYDGYDAYDDLYGDPYGGRGGSGNGNGAARS